MVFHIISPSQRGDFSCEFMSPFRDTVTRLVEPWARFSCEILVMQKDSVQNYFTNLDLPQNTVNIPSKQLPFEVNVGEVVWRSL